ncbi:MAG: VTT domain-containing protein [Chloroflexota bacterium]
MDKPSLESSNPTSPSLSSVPFKQDNSKGKIWPWQSVLLILGTILLTIVLLFVPVDIIDRLGAYGYLGVFLLTLLASASIVLPSPAVGVALIAGRTLDPWLVGVTAGVAAGFGEITGYLAGLGGSTFAAQSRFYPRVERWVQRWGVVTIFMLAVIPGPVFDLAGIAAGTMRMPFYRFLLACLSGKILRFIGVAWIGALLGDISWFH